MKNHKPSRFINGLLVFYAFSAVLCFFLLSIAVDTMTQLTAAYFGVVDSAGISWILVGFAIAAGLAWAKIFRVTMTVVASTILIIDSFLGRRVLKEIHKATVNKELSRLGAEEFQRDFERILKIEPTTETVTVLEAEQVTIEKSNEMLPSSLLVSRKMDRITGNVIGKFNGEDLYDTITFQDDEHELIYELKDTIPMKHLTTSMLDLHNDFITEAGAIYACKSNKRKK